MSWTRNNDMWSNLSKLVERRWGFFFLSCGLPKNWMHSFDVSLGYESVDRSTFSMKRFHTPMKLQKNAFSSYNYIQITQKFNIVEFFVVNFISVRLFAVGNYYAIDCLHLTSSWRHVQVRIWASLGCETSLL